MSKVSYKIVNVPVSDLIVDPDVQRATFDARKVHRFAANFDRNLLGHGTVSDRGHGVLVLIDGQHRAETIRRVEGNDGLFPCEVYTGLTTEEEARLFLGKNDGTRPTLYDRYRVGVNGKLDDVVAIDKIVHAYGLAVAKGNTQTPQRGTVNAIAALTKIYNLRMVDDDGEDLGTILDLTIRSISHAWGSDGAAYLATIIEGVGRLIHRNQGKIELDRLQKAMANYRGGPVALQANARQMSTLNKQRVWQNLAQLLITEYNKNLGEDSSRRLGHIVK